ncbi:hypothetical protein HSX37_05665|uniref:Uncharacterized protein n=1 Tax=Dendrosporobacter quercicolus TaxID=146817 RepID=A0A1G9P4E9_9FIRM|nr:hypothetical protein [Dendrosporobacter quercicolus]NSL47530.1 hypothetical protein [Dendrosporobacter quercicolus DSM 1736]SDL93097.1 hypothetical protein SAMN04488502_1011210 [Dendrosporobacter quercicolus]
MLYYTIDMLREMYRREQPNWPEDKIQEKAQTIHNLLNTLDVYWRRSNKRYYKMNIHLYSTYLIDMLLNGSPSQTYHYSRGNCKRSSVKRERC